MYYYLKLKKAFCETETKFALHISSLCVAGEWVL